MFRIRRIYDDTLPVNREIIQQVQQMLRDRFAAMTGEEIDKLPDKLRDPVKHRFRAILFVAEGNGGALRGFALLSHAPDLRFCYLDYIASTSRMSGRGIGGALYERVRAESVHLGAIGLFYECLPDDPTLCRDPDTLKDNRARLRFYEHYGARPIAGTAYETPLTPGDDNPPYLVMDPLDQSVTLGGNQAQAVVRAILERRYGHICPRDYIEMVVNSYQDNPIRLRPPRYMKHPAPHPTDDVATDERIVLLVNERHDIHHVRERGYVESPIRVRTIMSELQKIDLFKKTEPRSFSDKHLLEVHDPDYVRYFKRICEDLKPGKSMYPYVFPIRNAARIPRELAVRAGYFCIDTFTPLNKNAYQAARGAVDCGLTGAELLLSGSRLVYCLVRPPGHHAERHAFGGFCYFNTNAVAAHFLSRTGPVAILDIDYHHGNGQQNIFYERDDVLTVSIHGHPRFAYPYFSGFEDETGKNSGAEFNRNYPLPEHVDGDRYAETLTRALRRIRKYDPQFVIVALGLDTAKGDPTGTWTLTARDFERNGRLIGQLNRPILVVQEGGYNNRNLGINARHFFTGLWQETFRAPAEQSKNHSISHSTDNGSSSARGAASDRSR